MVNCVISNKIGPTVGNGGGIITSKYNNSRRNQRDDNDEDESENSQETLVKNDSLLVAETELYCEPDVSDLPVLHRFQTFNGDGLTGRWYEIRKIDVSEVDEDLLIDLVELIWLGILT